MIKKNTAAIFSIALYIIAGLLIVYSVWSFMYCADIITQAKASGQLAASGNEYDIASFYMGNCGQYFISALLLTAAGLLLRQKQPALIKPDISADRVKYGANDDELDDWFNETESNTQSKDE